VTASRSPRRQARTLRGGVRSVPVAPLLSLAAGAVAAAALHLPLLGTSLVSLFLFSCVLVGLAQQTLP
jgi:hypothetical protein